jgi:hypothetical protein
VPSDSDLWPGELPFTAFGQFGNDRLDLRVFDQDRYWVDRHGHPHEIAEMTLGYIENVIVMLDGRAVEFHAATTLRCALQAYGDRLLGRPNGDLLIVAAGAAGIADLDPGVWLESTPLMRALRRRHAISPNC